MSQRMQDVLTCPVCFELLRKPVLTLSCQHNLCRACVAQILRTATLQKRCPTCRENIGVEPNGLDKLPRNYLVEQMVEELEKVEVRSAPTVQHPNANNNSRLQKSADSLMNNRRYEDARKLYKQLDSFVTGLQLLKVKINLSKCYLELQDIKNTAVTTQALTDQQFPDNEKLPASQEMRNFAKHLSGCYENKAAIFLLQRSADLCDVIDDPLTKIVELMECLELMQGVSKSMSRKNQKNLFNDFGFPALQYIYTKITRIEHLPEETKFIKLAWSLKYVGLCCNEMGFFDKSVEYNKRAITLLRERLRHKAVEYRVLGVCYHNLAAAYKNLEKYSDAEATYLKAIEIYHSAKDWADQKRQNNSVILSAMGLSEAHKFLLRK
ncbi:uncharacterized protein LOC143463151 [Clavelina lepadiformis]|uniref:RING-type domain-containing protein n=1 Tax=Clavelina lepadiformis TaxID=159417 RepID=A0ABP0FNW9_CLALP